MSIELMEQANAARIDELEEQITQARHDYYNSTPTVSDEVYDAWVDELAELRADSPAVTAVGAPAVSAWPKVSHLIPMGSLSKVQTLDEMTSWVQTISRSRGALGGVGHERLLVTEKLDGISLSLRYVEGKLVQALTRGDGETGEDITPNAARMKGVLKNLPEPISVTCRGEVLLFKDDLEQHFPSMANPRNAASGTAKRLDGRGSEHLTVLVYQALEGPEFTTEVEQFEFLEKMGFKVPFWKVTAMAPGMKTPQDIWVDYQQSIRESLPYEIDGLVVRLDDLAYQWSLGEKNGRPLGTVAFKFTAITRETVAIDRIDQVGGTGRITPVAVFKPVRILGAEISRASLYNQKYVEEIGYGIGARILVSRANDVIPRVVSVSGKAAEVSQPPAVCPECGTETERDGEYIICPNVGGCPAQTEGRIKTWVQKQGILEWGAILIQKVVAERLVQSVADLYRLKRDDLAALERMGESSAQNALDELWKVVPMPLEMFLGSLGIPLCGRSTMTAVVDAGWDTLDKFRDLASLANLMETPGLGPKRARALSTWLSKNWSLIEDMQAAGITIKERAVGALTGKSVCFTGKSTMKRAALVKLVEGAGGTVKTSVTKGLTYLVLADANSTSTKAKAARKNGTDCVSEEDFLQMVGHES